MSLKQHLHLPPGTGMEIAIIGMAGRFPGAKNTREFWENLKNGVESISFFADPELLENGIDPFNIANSGYVKAKGFLPGMEDFDASFFGYTPLAAGDMDPQVRIFHECTWEALEDAAYDPGAYNGLIGIYAGASDNSDWQGLVLSAASLKDTAILASAQLCDKDHLCNHLSYKLNLRGPSFTVSSQCSTSLVAFHLACQGLLSGECDMALAGGISITFPPKFGYLYQEGLLLSADGHCRPFDARATGTIFGNGVGVVVLKRIQDAVSDRDQVYALVKASASNNDGNRKAGYSAPGVDGQAEVIRTALLVSQVEPETISYIETHGTGTTLGDPIEIEALKLAFDTAKQGFCRIGSVKGNVGHLDCASGITGLIKTVLALTHRLLPPSLHFETPNPGIDFTNSPFKVNKRLIPWESGTFPLRAGVSSFGIGGSNAYVILEEFPVVSRSVGKETGTREYQLILLSAKTESALDKMTRNLAVHLKKNPGINLADAAYTLQVGRKAFRYRWLALCSTITEATAALESPGGGETHMVAPEEESSTVEKPEPSTDKPSLTRIGRLWLHGKNIDWEALYPGRTSHRVSLPTYPFEHQHYPYQGGIIKLCFDMLHEMYPISRKQDMADWFYIPQWTRSSLVPENPGDSNDPPVWLIFKDDCGLGINLEKELKKKNQQVITVTRGADYKKISPGEFALDPAAPEDYHRLFADCFNRHKSNVPNRIVHLWGAGNEADDREMNIESLQHMLDSGLFSLLNIARAIGKEGITGTIRVGTVTSHMQEVVEEQVLCPAKAAVLGAVRSIPQEYSNIKCCCIDVTPPPPGSSREAELIRRLTGEFTGSFSSPVIAFRGDYRWVQTFEPIRLNPPQNENITPGSQLREKGVYLITGGLGGIGLTLAQYLAEKAKARLILTTGSRFPGRNQWEKWLGEHEENDKIGFRIQKLRELESLGAEVLVFQADVANRQHMEKVIEQVKEQYGRINGIIHCAGTADYAGVIQRREPGITKNILAPKVNGTLVLHRVLQEMDNEDLDFFVLCSSVSSILAPFGEVGYVAANAFLDAFAHYRNVRCKGKTISINWGAWQQVGMAVEAAKKASRDPNVTLSQDILPSEGIDAFNRILESPLLHSQVVVSVKDLPQLLRRRYTPRTRDEEKSSFTPFTGKDEQQTAPVIRRPHLATKYIKPQNRLEQSLAEIFRDFLGIDKIGIDDNFFELGINSLDLVQINRKLKSKLNKEIQMVSLFTYSTVRKLARHLNREEEPGKPAGKDETAGQPETANPPGEDLLQDTIDLLREN